MPVIAMTRELGSRGNEVAEGLAQDLGLALVRHDFVERLAESARLSTCTVMRWMDGRATLLERWRAERSGLPLFVEEQLLERAALGRVVIRGWGAIHLLRAVPHALCVRVCAPIDVRAQRMMDILGLESAGRARDEVLRSDACRAAALRRHFGDACEQAPRYDMVLDTGTWHVGRCIAQIRRALELREYQPTPESRALLAALALSARIRSALRRDHATAGFRISVQSNANGRPGHVALEGMVIDEGERLAAEDVARRCDGVSGIENRLRPMWSGRIARHLNG